MSARRPGLQTGRVGRAVSAAAAAALAIGCSFPQERAILDQFFSASRLRDTTALAAFSTVIFEPLEDGIVTTFEIQSVAEGTTGESSSGGRPAATKTVTLTAPLGLPDGTVVEKTLTVTLQQRDDRWIVTGFRF
jgi:hypothetical protein